ncbi:MAG: hypothetical protein RR359_03310 [Bacilli bacterium]
MEYVLTLDNLRNCFNYAIERKWKYIAVKIRMQGFEKDEIIINETENFEKKLEYYEKAYNEDLTLKTFNGIKIVGFTYSDSFTNIEWDLLGVL